MRRGAELGGTPGVLILIGTRPEAIKLAPVARALRARPETIEVRILSTGQHDELLASALASLELEIDEDLGIMTPDQDLYDVGMRCLEKLRPTLRAIAPDIVVVEGDTATVLFGALAAFFERVPVAHVEAGLRSGDKWAPYPEEVFRRLCDVVSDLHLAPTPRARDNLLAENVGADRIHVTGNTVIDAVRALADSGRAIENAELAAALASGERIVLITAHRRESFGEPMHAIFRAVRRLAEAHSDVVFVYPVHPNPNVRGPADAAFEGAPNVRLLQPLSYSDLVNTLARSTLVLTDSGGIQEEAPSFGVPVIVLRAVTERPEGIEAGAAVLAGTTEEKIVEWGSRLLDDPQEHARMARARNPYGDGRAGERIADILIHKLLGVARQTEDWS